MNEILREVGKIYRCLNSLGNIEFKKFDLAKGQFSYLVRICENPGIIQERIAELLYVDRTTTARGIQKLEKSGFISRRNDPENKKVLLLYPTEKGMKLYEILHDEEIYSNQTALHNISTDEQKTLLELLEKMRCNLEPDWNHVKKGGQREYLKKHQDLEGIDSI